MGKKILDSKALYVILSILLSVSAWLYVTSLDVTKDSIPIRCPVQLTDVDILEDRGLMVVSEELTAVINPRATTLVLATLRSNPPTLKASVSNITSEGEHTMVYTIEPPEGVRQSDVEYVNTGSSGNTVKVEVARFLRREVPVKGDFQGKTAEGYLAGDQDDFRFSPATVWVSGRAEDVNQVACARVIVTGEELTETVNESLPFQLIGASGDPLEGLKVSCDTDQVYTVFPIRATAEIPLEVRVAEGGGLKESDVEIQLSVPSIMVAGSREAVTAQVNEGALTLAVIELATVRDGDELTYSIPLTDELENLSGVSTVTVTVRVKKRVEIRTFETASISVINVPEGWRADIITQVLQVEVRGTKALLDELLEENILVVADLRDITQAAGPYTVSANVYLNSAGSKSEIGELNPSSYTITISLVPDG